jgi:hypothetical protein
MKIDNRALRMLVESVLLEGFKDDQRYLIEKFPDHAADISALPPKWIMWLISRFGESPTQKEIHPFDDAIVTVKNYSKKDAALGAKYADPGTEERPNVFKPAVDEAFPTDQRRWKAPSDISVMNVDEMELILGLSERKKPKFKVDTAEDIEGDRVGKVGPWNLWMPTTRENSCKIAGYDPVTLQPKTTWCTARMAGSNLFYNYIGRPGEETTLFYIINDDPKSNTDWLSLGFINGKPELSGEDGGLSVDRDNRGLNVNRLKQILGPYHDEIMRTLSEKNRTLGGKHPAREKMAAAAKSVEALDYLVKSLSAEEATDIKRAILGYETSPEVLIKLAGDPNEDVRAAVAHKRSIPPEILVRLAGDPKQGVRYSVARHKSIPPEILARLAGDPEQIVRSVVARHASMPPEILARLAGDPAEEVRKSVALNPSTPVEFLVKLAGDPNGLTRTNLVLNPSTPPEILAQFAGDPSSTVRQYVGGNPKTPAENLARLAGDPDVYVRLHTALNPSTPVEFLAKLADDSHLQVRAQVSMNPATPIDVLKKLLKDRSESIRSSAASFLRRREAAGLTESRLRQLIRHLV